MDSKKLLDSEIAAVLDTVPPQMAWDPPAMRAAGEKMLSDEITLPAGITREIVQVASKDGYQVELRVFRPENREPQGVIYSIHGGGMIAGQARYDDGWNGQLAAETGQCVVSPNYRLAPENPYPLPLQDCVAGWQWVKTEFPALPSVIYGDSAGGNLAAAVTLFSRDQGIALADRVFLIEPVLDDRLGTVSMQGGQNTPVWDLPNAKASWKAYLGGEKADIYAAPGRASDLSGWPKTFMVANQCDPLRDEDIRFAQTLTECNVPVHLTLLPGTCHGVLGLQGPAIADQARELVINTLKSAGI